MSLIVRIFLFYTVVGSPFSKAYVKYPILERHALPSGASFTAWCDLKRVKRTSVFLNREYDISITLSRKGGCGWNREVILVSVYRDLDTTWKAKINEDEPIDRWEVDILPPGNRIQLTVRNAVFDDSGYYTCRAFFMRDKFGLTDDSERKEFLRVGWDLPVLDKTEVAPGDDFKITCRMFTLQLPVYISQLFTMHITFRKGIEDCSETKPIRLISMKYDPIYAQVLVTKINPEDYIWDSGYIGSDAVNEFCNYTLSASIRVLDMYKHAGYYTCTAEFYSPFTKHRVSSVNTTALLRPKEILSPILSPDTPVRSGQVTVACDLKAVTKSPLVSKVWWMRLHHPQQCYRRIVRYNWANPGIESGLILKPPRRYSWLLHLSTVEAPRRERIEWTLEEVDFHDDGYYFCQVNFYCPHTNTNVTAMISSRLTTKAEQLDIVGVNRKGKPGSRGPANRKYISLFCDVKSVNVLPGVTKIVAVALSKKPAHEEHEILARYRFRGRNRTYTNFPEGQKWEFITSSLSHGSLETISLEIRIPKGSCEDMGNYVCMVTYRCPNRNLNAVTFRSQTLEPADIPGCRGPVTFNPAKPDGSFAVRCQSLGFLVALIEASMVLAGYYLLN